MSETTEQSTPDRNRTLATGLGWIWAIVLCAIILATFFPVLGRKQQVHHGETCNENLDQIFQAKQKWLWKTKIGSAGGTVHESENPSLEDLFPGRSPECPAGGTYTVGPLTDQNGEVIPPVCSLDDVDPDGNGINNDGEGLHIHSRSYLQDPGTGIWFRDPAFVFPKYRK